MSSIYVSNYSTMHTKFQARDNYGEGCRRVIARASGKQNNIPDDTAWDASNEKYFDSLIETDSLLFENRINLEVHSHTIRIINRSTAREYKSPSRKRISDTKKSSSGDSGDSDQPEPPSPPGLAYLFAYPRLITHTPKKNRYSSSWQSAPGYCCMQGGGRA